MLGFFLTIFVYIFETQVSMAMEVLQMMQVIKNLFTRKLKNSRLVPLRYEYNAVGIIFLVFYLSDCSMVHCELDSTTLILVNLFLDFLEKNNVLSQEHTCTCILLNVK